MNRVVGDPVLVIEAQELILSLRNLGKLLELPTDTVEAVIAALQQELKGRREARTPPS